MNRLLFVYNAESGLANGLLDTGRRIFRPGQYPCALCMITYGPFGMKNDWKKFVSQLPYKVSFPHNDELPEKLQSMRLDFPCLLMESPQATKVVLGGAEFRKIHDLQTLQKKVIESLQADSSLPS